MDPFCGISSREDYFISSWVHLSNIASIFQSLVDINWTTSNIENLIRFDVSKERRDRLVFAKGPIEFTPSKKLPIGIPFLLGEG